MNPLRHVIHFTAAAIAAFSFVTLATPRVAEACGCFAPPNPAQPVVQAGERIVFAHEDGKVVAHIQIQYQGDAEEFAWLVPVPAVPDLRLGVEELFTALEDATTPQFLLNQTGSCGGGGPSLGCAASDFANAGIADPMAPPIAVKQASAGPYDYAVVRADEKQPMIDWLNDNRYFVPEGTAEAIDPYIRPGSYFLALKLRAGESTGDLQPVVLEYESDLPMIPIILTSVAAINDMGILVWVLGEDRAIPHNYQHVEINDEYIDWVGGAQNYSQVVARAIDEAEGGHAFVTEYADTTGPMVGVLDWTGRFPSRAEVEGSPHLRALMNYLRSPGFTWGSVQLVLQAHYPMPAQAIAQGVSEENYYRNLENSVQQWDPEAEFDAAAIAADVWERIVDPTTEAGAMFRTHRMMTRLYTLLDPAEMTKDPVFAFNPDLPLVPRLRSATLERTCDDDIPFIMQLADGRRFDLENQPAWNERDLTGVPRTRMVQVLRQEGPPEVVVDNRALLEARDDGADGGGCQSTAGHRSRIASFGLMFLLVFVGRQLLRRRV